MTSFSWDDHTSERRRASVFAEVKAIVVFL
jgi:hypothetical protein